MSADKINLPPNRKDKISLLKQLQAGQSIEKVLTILLPEKFMVIRDRGKHILFEGKAYDHQEIESIIEQKKKQSNLTVIRVTYGKRNKNL